MEWSEEAREMISRVPFFVRKRVRRKVEEEAARSGSDLVTLEHVRSCQRNFLNRMEDEIAGYQIETCFGPGGCPNRVILSDELPKKLEGQMSKRDLKAFLKGKVGGPLKVHHEFRISISDCPNACSRPQIADIGLLGASVPEISDQDCSQCGNCVETCKEQAIYLKDGGPFIDRSRCLSCGQCIRVCPTHTLMERRTGYRIQVGGKLGRHPRLGAELPGIYQIEEVLGVVENCLDYYQIACRKGERFGELLGEVRFDQLKNRIKQIQQT